MIHPIVKYGDPVLETQAKRIEKFDEELEKLVADMFESMYAAAGVGLAAPQIGIGMRIAVIDVSNGKNPEAKLVCANPEIIHAEGEQREEEGCLSLPGFRGTRGAAAVRDGARARRFRQRIRNARRRIAGARVLPRDRPSERNAFHHAPGNDQARHDQAQDPQAEKSRRVVGRLCR